MKLIRYLHNLKPEHRGGVLTIGNFDGMHLGHQAMLARLRELAHQHGTHSLLMTFRPLPHEYFGRGEPPSRLMNLREKVQVLKTLDAAPDYLLLTRFDDALAGLDAETFIASILVARLAVKAVVVGDDFRFGAARQGDFAMLQAAGEASGFEVMALSTHKVDNSRVSSTRVRDALLANDLDTARRLLGRPYSIEGRVAHGDKRGRTIGFPTANIHLHRPATALQGVYAVTLRTADGHWHAGVANLGKRPTVNGERKQLEVHLFDFDRDIYGEHVCIRFLHKLRNEKKFDSFDALKQQIHNDCLEARRLHRLDA